MPFVPSVPHIVGDDDDSNDATDSVDMSTKSPGSSVRAESSLELNNQTSDSELDESSFEEGPDDDGGSSSNSSAEEEGEDWSNNISYIVATPSRESEQMKTEEDVIEENQEKPAVIEENAEEEQIPEPTFVEMSIIETPDQPSESEMSNNLTNNLPEQHPPETTSPAVSNEIDEVEPAIEKPIESPNVKNLNVQHKASQVKIIDALSPISRRLSLRSANRSSNVKYAASPKRIVRGRPRKTMESKRLSPKIFFGRAAKHVNSKSSTISSPSSNNIVLKAKPLDVTEYFAEISATLVSQRVNELPFQYLCKRISRLVTEALDKTNMQNNYNASDSA